MEGLEDSILHNHHTRVLTSFVDNNGKIAANLLAMCATKVMETVLVEAIKNVSEDCISWLSSEFGCACVHACMHACVCAWVRARACVACQ